MKSRKSNVKFTCTKVRPKQEDKTVMLKDQFIEAGYKAKQQGNRPIITPGYKEASNALYCAVIGDVLSGIFYTDMTGAFPVVSLEGKHYYFIVYDYI